MEGGLLYRSFAVPCFGLLRPCLTGGVDNKPTGYLG